MKIKLKHFFTAVVLSIILNPFFVSYYHYHKYNISDRHLTEFESNLYAITNQRNEFMMTDVN
ncbi:hypothetical protein VN24_25785 [Paenibacillus beijingensis]|uniref:Uncharacterized protein n=1 Tax=Paenibacillus beijingensis TaxID=1126833 RepID=A0A0D5NQS1_9BACL|nr:hypothetical protein VN24_25785 [Paenibacillus beijingensis]